jgi:tripartite-type tricarboxylate transporter receptor subunit TctC
VIASPCCRAVLAALALVANLVALPAFAQYPSKPIRLIVPFPPGGAADFAARVVATPLAQELGQPIVVENKAGADGAIAGDLLVKSAPDGYTLLFATNTGMLAAPTLRKNPPYDPINDFTPVSLVGRFGFFLFVHPSVPATNVQELIAYIRANPGKLNYGTGNSTSIIATAQLALNEKLEMVHVPYKGDAPLTLDLVTGRVQMVFATPGTAMQHVKDGKLRVLATLLPERSALAPDAPTMTEAGLRGLTITPWAAFFGPAKLPREVVDRLARATQTVLARKEVRDQLGNYAFEGASSTPEELGAFVKDQYEVWRKTVKDVGIVPD